MLKINLHSFFDVVVIIANRKQQRLHSKLSKLVSFKKLLNLINIKLV